MPIQPSNDLRWRYRDLLPPDAAPDELDIIAALHHTLTAPEPPAALVEGIRRQARLLARQSSQRLTLLAADEQQSPRAPRPSTTPAHLVPRRSSPIRSLAALLTAAVLVGLFALVYRALLLPHTTTPAVSSTATPVLSKTTVPTPLLPTTPQPTTIQPTPSHAPSPSPTMPPLALALGNTLMLEGGARTITEEGKIAAPMWSPSGQWLAYQLLDQQTVIIRRIAQGDERRIDLAKVITGPLRNVAWSPSADLLAVVTEHGELYLYQPGSSPVPVSSVDGSVDAVAWSPDGQSLAVAQSSATGTPPSTLLIVPASGKSARSVASSPENTFVLAGWWPNGQGLLYWELPLGSQSLAADGVPLRSLNLADGSVMTVATMQPDPNALALSPPNQASPQLIVASSTRREQWAAPHSLRRCDLLTQQCQPLANVPSGLVVLDPSWAPDGALVAYIAAPALTNAPNSDTALAEWVAGRRLVLSSPDGSPAPDVPADVEHGVLQTRWISPQSLLVLQSPVPGSIRLLWYNTTTQQVVVVADLSQAVAFPDVNAYGQRLVSIEDIAAWPR